MDNKTKAIADELLKTFDFAQELSDEQLEYLVQDCELQEVPAGTIIAEKGSYCQGLALLLWGQLRVAVNSEDGREVTIYNINQGKVCPLSAACVLGGFKGNTVTVELKLMLKLFGLCVTSSNAPLQKRKVFIDSLLVIFLIVFSRRLK